MTLRIIKSRHDLGASARTHWRRQETGLDHVSVDHARPGGPASAAHRSREELDVRIVYRVKEPTDLEITDLYALKSLESDGCKVRFSNRLHAKLLLIDDRAAIVSSSNLTATAGYGLDHKIEARNEELGILLEKEPSALQDLEKEFGQIWDASTALTEDTLGIVMEHAGCAAV